MRRGHGRDRCGTSTVPWRGADRFCSPVGDNGEHAHDEDIDVNVERDDAEHEGDDAKHAHVDGDDGALLKARNGHPAPGANIGTTSYDLGDERLRLTYASAAVEVTRWQSL